jgi:2-isopropylmalate synthase
MGEVLVRIRSGERSFTGRGISTDIIEASAKSYLSALNQKVLHLKETQIISENEKVSEVI